MLTAMMFHSKVAEFQQLRLKSDPLPLGVAPVVSSDAFKSRSSQSKPKAKMWDHRLSDESHARCASTLKGSSRSTAVSSMIPLGTARPASQYYPWHRVDMHGLKTSAFEDLDPITPAAAMSCRKGEAAYDLAVAMNYGAATGSPQLLRFITEHVELIHDPPYADWEIVITCGTTSALEMLFRMLCNRGDCVLTEQYTYSGALEAVKPLEISTHGISTDQAGLIPEDLDLVLRNWNSAKSPKPTVLYTIPSGQNPTGVTQTAERRKAIYEVAEQHDLIIIEDDPYYFLQFGEDLCVSKTARNSTVMTEEYVRRLPPSYLSLDTSSRVLRLDTASKILAPGLRVGWLTGCSWLTRKFLNHTEFSTTSPSGPSQVMMFKLLDENWGHVGFINWLIHLSSQYSRRLRTMLEACRVNFPAQICDWKVPTSGMFLWIRIDWRSHPLAQQKGRSGELEASRLYVEDRVYEHAAQNGVQVSKGSWFATETRSETHIYFRLTFAAAPEESLKAAIMRFGLALRAEFLLNDMSGIEQASCTILSTRTCLGG